MFHFASILKFKSILFRLKGGQKRLGQKSDPKYKKANKTSFLVIRILLCFRFFYLIIDLKGLIIKILFLKIEIFLSQTF